MTHTARTAGPEAPAFGELDRAHLIPWLDGILRPGARISIGDDTPLLFDGSEHVAHRLLLVGDKPAAHAAARTITIDVRGGSIAAAIVGAVATAPERRGLGLGSRVISVLLDDLRARGVTLAILWADVPDFYEKLGFVLAGREWIHACPRACWSTARRIQVRRARRSDVPAIAALHDLEICRARRTPETWETLLSLPQTEPFVLTDGGAVVAYGVVGRGHDLRGCLHEWGGDDVVLPTLVSGILEHRREAELFVMSPPWKHQASRALAYHGVEKHEGPLAYFRVLDRAALLASTGKSDDTGLPAGHDALVRALFGAPGAAPQIVPLYLYGLDSM